MNIDWIAVDWGTSNLRIWAMNHHGDIIDEIHSDQGMGALKPNEFENVLLSHIHHWLNDNAVMPVIACGMVGARQGWREAPYVHVPTMPASKFIQVASHDKRIDVRILSGVQQNQPADVMRGEETQIAGFLSLNPNVDAIICLPGTHAKWVEIKNQNIMRFQTCMTGEIFALLSQYSVLKHSMGNAVHDWDNDIFSDHVNRAYRSPTSALNNLFEIRAADLLHQQQYGMARLSGKLIGAEIANMTHFWQDNNITLIGTGELTQHYHDAFRVIGINANIYNGDNLSLAGLKQAYQKLMSIS